MSGSPSSARARLRRWRWPPERVTPRSPRRLSSPWGKRSSTSSAAARARPWRSCRWLASGAVRRRLAARVSENRKLSWGTTCTRRRSCCRSRSRTSCQPLSSEPSSTRPAPASVRRGRRLANRLLPVPVAPTRATTSPGSRLREQSSRIFRPPPGALTLTPSRRNPRGAWGSRALPLRRCSGSSSNCQMRSALERASAKVCITRPMPSMRNTRVVTISRALTSSPIPSCPAAT